MFRCAAAFDLIFIYWLQRFSLLCSFCESCRAAATFVGFTTPVFSKPQRGGTVLIYILNTHTCNDV